MTLITASLQILLLHVHFGWIPDRASFSSCIPEEVVNIRNMEMYSFLASIHAQDTSPARSGAFPAKCPQCYLVICFITCRRCGSNTAVCNPFSFYFFLSTLWLMFRRTSTRSRRAIVLATSAPTAGLCRLSCISTRTRGAPNSERCGCGR